uniref:Uncharacterized protein LOC117365011 isoform X2 n=1 Tax=Geotrypetes seraphini TaxID=260995 RepID=A0A6P8RYW0_GEOSA|nr:uncharacterized protein LOC117365011 isoform X2 [Geotrypetes seraphini]
MLNMLSCGFTPTMDVKAEPAPDWAANSLKHEEEEVPSEACSHPLVLPSTPSIKQEAANENTMEAGEAASPKVPEIILKTEAAWEASEQKLEQIVPDALVPQVWKHENGSQELMCRMCGQVVAACTLADVREHLLQCRSHALHNSVAQKGCYMAASKEGLVLKKETEDKPLLCIPTSSGISCSAGHTLGNSAPAEIEVSIDPEEQPANSKHVQARGRVQKHSGSKKSKKTVAKRPRQPKEKGKKNPQPSTAQTYSHRQGQDIKYTPINLAPAEIQVFTDGSFPKGFILRLYSRGKACVTDMRTAYSYQVNLGFRVVCLHLKGYSYYSIAQALCQKISTIQYILRYWKSHGIVPHHQRGKNLCPAPPLAHNQALHNNTQPKGREKASHSDLKYLHGRTAEEMTYGDTKFPALARKRARSLLPSDTDVPTRKSQEAGPLMHEKRASSHGITENSTYQREGGGRRTLCNISEALGQQGKRQRKKIQQNRKPCRKFCSSWRKEYLMDYNSNTGQMVCMVCEKTLVTVRLATITRHIQDCHSDTLNLPHQVRKTILNSWKLRKPQLLMEPKDKKPLPEKIGKELCHLDKSLEKKNLPKLNQVSLKPSAQPVHHRRYFQDHWRTRYLVEYDWRSDKMVCLVCGMSMGSKRICTIKRHAQRRHPSSLTFSTEKRQRLLERWLRGDTHHTGQKTKQHYTAKQEVSDKEQEPESTVQISTGGSCSEKPEALGP